MTGKTGYRTKQQEELIAFLKETAGEHHTVAQIREYFDSRSEPIGTTTIYRQLEKLVETGVACKYSMETGEGACYGYAPEACATHFHCKCDRCGRLIHLDCDELDEVRSHLLSHHGFQWDTRRTVLYGICDQCRKA